MTRRHYSLPPLTTLSSFEAAARKLSFKDAATELNVTPGAVSHQIKALEGELGVALFDRKHRGVDLTPHGLKLFHSLERSFLDISRVLAQIQRSAEDTSVSVAATTAVSSLWLTPRITRFWKEHGNVAVNQVVSDGAGRHGTTTDLRIGMERIATRTRFRRNCSSISSARFAAPECATLLGRRLWPNLPGNR